MTVKEYTKLAERSIAKGIITDTELSRQMPVMMSVRELRKMIEVKEVKPEKQKSYSPAEMKQIFNNLIQNV